MICKFLPILTHTVHDMGHRVHCFFFSSGSYSITLNLSIRNENSMKKFSDDGIPTKQSPLEVSESSDVIITMLPSSTHVSRLFL